MRNNTLKIFFLIILSLSSFIVSAQFRAKEINWTPDGTAYLKIVNGNIVRTDVKTNNETTVVKREQLMPAGSAHPLAFDIYSFSQDNKTLLIFTNTAKVWRYNTRGDYWVLNISSNQLTQLGKSLPSQSLMYAKISPDAQKSSLCKWTQFIC